MKQIIALAALLTLASAHDFHGQGQHARLAKRLTTTASSAAASSAVSATASSAASPAASSSALSGATSGSAVVAAASASGPPASGVLTSTPHATATDIPSLEQITSGMTSAATSALTTTYSAGATPPISGAPAIPSFAFSAANWPTMDKTPDTSSAEVQEWMKELDGFNIPNLNPTADGTCAGDPTAAADAANRGWWTCGGYTRSTDVVACPDKLTWGMSFDDGPAAYTPRLLEYLDQKDLKATFFVVGSRVIERPDVLRDEFMSGHEISVHTWSHPELTKLTNEQIVAELGWTRKAIQEVLGVTPVTMRPPYGDIDDRVRAIALAMGLQPIIWTRGPQNNQFDTNDWKVPGGVVTGEESFQMFQWILGNATQMNTGFIVLEHDLFEQTVDLAVGYTLDSALSYSPALTLKSIGTCQGWPASNMYLETTTNTTFPYLGSLAAENATTTAAARATAASSSAKAAGKSSGAAHIGMNMPALGSLLAAASVLVGGMLVI